ncbi:MAG: hypothetical protein LWX83_08710 [Anaerolineae bacterium]|nr:hypothetical protein [Anaerolineae bacterium]
MDKDEIICPVCGRSQNIYKVSQIYLESLTIFDKNSPHPIFDEMFGEAGKDLYPLPSRYGHDFTRTFSPPSGRAEWFRPIHPDIFIFVFTVLIAFFLYSIYAQQPSIVYPFLIILGVAFIVYFAFRKKLVSRYQAEVAEGKNSFVSVDLAVARWMKLYYCAKEGLVFDPETKTSAALDEMKKYLLKA